MSIGGRYSTLIKKYGHLTDKPLWKGERGKRVVLWKEQGIGDDIIFLSLAPEVQADG